MGIRFIENNKVFKLDMELKEKLKGRNNRNNRNCFNSSDSCTYVIFHTNGIY